MPSPRSNLFQLAHKDRKECVCPICDRTRIPLVLDISTGWLICGPCVPFVLQVERWQEGGKLDALKPTGVNQ